MTPEERARRVCCEWDRKYPRGNYEKLIAEAIRIERSEAIEECARVVSLSDLFCRDEKKLQHQLAAAIRALKD